VATIYDVAKHAGTSISTVSHFLNKTKYVGPDKSQKIKEAIEALAYVPNRAAKSLKTKASSEIHIILPNISDPLFSHTYTGIADATLPTGYTPILHLTGDLVSRENMILERVQKSNPAGIVLCTCQPDNTTLLDKIELSYPTCFLYRSPRLGRDVTTMTFDNERTVYRITRKLLTLGYDNIGLVTGKVDFSCEEECVEGYKRAYENNECDFQSDHIQSLPQHKEAAFKYLSFHYEGKSLPDCVIASSSIFTSALKDLYAIRRRKDYLLITLGYESWYNKDLSKTILQTIRETEKVGYSVINTLLTAIEKPSEYEKQSFIFGDQFSADILEDVMLPMTTDITKPHEETLSTKSIKLLVLDDATSLSAMRSLIPHFENTHNTKVILESCPYDKLHEKILENSKDNEHHYDLYSVDMPWIPDLARDNIIAPLNKTLTSMHKHNTVKTYEYPSRLALYNKTLYGIPYLIGLQLLFYRKDLFDNRQLREEFYELYNRELTPPTDWYSFNQIASFFTKSINQASPTTYGTCLADYFQGSILGEILPRIWGYEGRIIDEDMFPSLCTPPVKKAIENYIEVSKYGTTKTTHYAQDVARAFSQGDIAMITSYISYAPMMYDQLTTTLSGMIDFAPMPSDSSMVSGWSLCINEKSRNNDSANAFLKWFLSADISYRYTLMTGNPTRHELYSNSNINKLYPWLSLSLDAFEKGHTRRLFGDNATDTIDSESLESIISNIITKQQNSKSSIHSLLKQADRDLLKMINATD